MSRRVYFIRPIGMEGPIKIGCSHSPDGRRSTLETWSPFPLEIVAEIEGGEKLERRFHCRFFDQHQSREWFRWSPELAETIDAINAGTFSIASLPEPRRLPSMGAGCKPGTKWSPQRRTIQMRAIAMRKAEKLSGLVRHWGTDPDDFIADPWKHGITVEERNRRTAEWRARHGLETVSA